MLLLPFKMAPKSEVKTLGFSYRRPILYSILLSNASEVVLLFVHAENQCAYNTIQYKTFI